MQWLWLALGIVGGLVLLCVLFLVFLFFFIRRHYLDHLMRVFQERPLFIIPRGQPVPDAEELLEAVEVDGLDGVVVEPGFPGAETVLLLAVAGEGDERDGLELRVGAQATGDLEAVHAGQA